MVDLRAAPVFVGLVVVALASVARADDAPSARERTYADRLAASSGAEQPARLERVSRGRGRGVRVTLDGLTTERLRFGSRAEAEAFARALPVGETGLVEVRGGQVLVARGPRLSDPAVVARLRASGWEVLPAPPGPPSVVRDLTARRGSAPVAPSAPPASRADNHGVTELLAHHLLGDDLRQLRPRTAAGAQRAAAGAPREVVSDAVAAVASETMGAHQRGRVLPAYDALSAADRAAFDDLLALHADQPAVRDQLLRALAASSSIDDMRWLAGQLAGRDPSWIAANTRLSAPGGGASLQQQYSDSCAPTTVQALRAEYDPVYALRTRQDNSDVTIVPGEGGNEAVALEQRTILEANGGRVAVGEVRGEGLDDESWIHALNQEARRSGLAFRLEGAMGDAVPAERAIALLDEHLSQGRVVPLGLTGSKGGGHAVLATAVRRDAPGEASFLVFDPGEGVSTWVTSAQIRQGNVNLSGWDSVETVLVPTTKT